MLNNIVDNHEQCGQHNIVACCFQNLEQVIIFCRVVVELSSYMLKVPNIAAVDSQCLPVRNACSGLMITCLLEVNCYSRLTGSCEFHAGFM